MLSRSGPMCAKNIRKTLGRVFLRPLLIPFENWLRTSPFVLQKLPSAVDYVLKGA